MWLTRRAPRMRGRSAGAVVSTATAACLLLSCTGEPAPEGGREPSSSPRVGAAPLPVTPRQGHPADLARQLDRAVATLRDERATAPDVRRAAEFHQLAVRLLADRGGRFGRDVTDRLSRQAAVVTRACVRATRRLAALNTPRPELPDWRIVTPPPPRELLSHYRAAQRRTGVPWTYLAAIHLVETRMGRIRGTSTAGARGPMQFLPSTWALYGAGGDITDPGDAIHAAARLLAANGAPDDMAEALWHYNPSGHYVEAVTAYAGTLRRFDWAYRNYWHWRVLYSHRRGTYVLPVGYPDSRALRVAGE